jgi:hypothetical protein
MVCETAERLHLNHAQAATENCSQLLDEPRAPPRVRCSGLRSMCQPPLHPKSFCTSSNPCTDNEGRSHGSKKGRVKYEDLHRKPVVKYIKYLDQNPRPGRNRAYRQNATPSKQAK